MKKLIRKFTDWWTCKTLKKEINDVCKKASERVSKMSREEKNQSLERAYKIIFPNGYWLCDKHGEHSLIMTANGEQCKLCKKKFVD